MKKRRELDALVSKSLTSRSSLSKTKNGNHELLRNDSESSDGEEFVLPEKDIVPSKKPKSNFCLTCMLLFSFIMLLSCFGIIGSLLWMFIQLRNEVQDLKLHLDKVEAGEIPISEKIQSLYMKNLEMNKRMKDMELRNQELIKMVSSVTLLQAQVAALQNLTKSLHSSFSTFSLVDDLKDLSKTIADVGSSMKTLEEKVEEMKMFKLTSIKSLSNLEDRVQSIQLASSKLPSLIFPSIGNKNLNATEEEFLSSIRNVTSTLVANQNRVMLVELERLEMTVKDLKNLTGLMNSRISFLEIKPPEVSEDDVVSILLLQLKNETFADVLTQRVRENFNKKLKAIDDKVESVTRSFKEEMINISVLVKTLNSTCTSLTDMMTSLETKLVLLAEQEHQVQSATTTTTSTPDDNKLPTDGVEMSTTTLSSDDKNGMGALSEVAPTSSIDVPGPATSSHPFVGGHDANNTPSSSPENIKH